MAKRETIQFFTELGGRPLVDDVKSFEKLVRWYDRRFGSKRRSLPWFTPGNVEQVVSFERGLRLRCERGWVELRWMATDCLRVRWLRQNEDHFIEPFSYAVVKVDWPAVPLETRQGDDAILMKSPELVCRIGKRPFRLGLETPTGDLICVDTAGMQSRDDGLTRLCMALQPDEACYGLGERAFGLQLRGHRCTLWNTDPPTFHRGSDPLYYNVPFYLGVHNRAVYGLFWDNSSRTTADLGAARADELVLESESGEARYYLFAAADVKRVLSRYTELTGRIPLPPLWSLGYHQCRFSYYPEETVLKVAEEFRSRGIPCDAIYLDIHYMDGFRVFTWDKQHFPKFKEMLDRLHDRHFKAVAIADPGIKIDGEYETYRSGVERNVFLRYPDNKLVAGAVWPGMCHFPDFTDPAARAWWAEQMGNLLEAGIDGIWNDMCEPAIFTQDGAATLPDYVRHNYDGLGGCHLEHHNVYGMLMGRASYEAQLKHRPNARPFNIIRAGYAGAQRYASSWTGDNTSDWDHLRLSISMTLNMGLSGAPFTGPDIGGFQKDTNAELFTRWLQAACLLPFFRSHTALGTAAQEPWAFGQPYEVINRLTIMLRYRLLPYLYSVFAQAREYGWPIVRPLFMAEPDNPDLRAADDCYLLGDALLVAPVVQAGAVRRSVYLPKGNWYDYWTNERLKGGRTIEVPAPLERLPLFVRAGAALPLWPEMQYANPQAVETLVYRVYPGEFETVLYEDAGEGLAYLDGDYRWIYLTCGWEDSKLVVNRRVAGRYQPPYQSVRLEVVGLHDEPLQVKVNRQSAPLWFYDDDLLEVTVDDFQRVEIIRKPLPTDKTIARRPW
ncbi:MAG: DUF4968 domain-containing protein [Chloroflexi bacterium]|nr:DUF4968 domain-containing protein [Chloroflexota bacterium]